MCFPFPYYRMILPASFITPLPPTNHLLPCKSFPHEKYYENTVKMRNHEQILKKPKELQEEELPVLQYHKQCYQEITHKS